MKQALLYMLLSGIVHSAGYYTVLPVVVDLFDPEVEAAMTDPDAITMAVPEPPIVYVQVELPEEEEPEIEPEPVVEEEEEVEVEPVPPEPEPEPEIRPERVPVERVRKPEVEPTPEPEPDDQVAANEDPAPADDEPEADANPDDGAGGQEAVATAAAEAPPAYSGAGGAGSGSGRSVGDGSQDQGAPGQGTDIDRDALLKGYQRDLAKIFQAHKTYPRRARRQGIEGEVVVEVVVDRTGSIVSYKVVKSSGHDPLDQAALEAVAAIDRLPAPPSELAWKKRKLRIPYRYRLG